MPQYLSFFAFSAAFHYYPPFHLPIRRSSVVPVTAVVLFAFAPLNVPSLITTCARSFSVTTLPRGRECFLNSLS